MLFACIANLPEKNTHKQLPNGSAVVESLVFSFKRTSLDSPDWMGPLKQSTYIPNNDGLQPTSNGLLRPTLALFTGAQSRSALWAAPSTDLWLVWGAQPVGLASALRRVKEFG